MRELLLRSISNHVTKPLYALVLDVGTSSIKAFVFDRSYNCLAMSERELATHRCGVRVEQNPYDYVRFSRSVMRSAFRKSNVDPSHLVAGITNQRETVIVWDRETGRSVYPAIVWQDRRTQKQCASMAEHATRIRGKTGLELLPYFSASKLSWILKHVAQSRTLASHHRLLCGTVDTWLMWNMLSNNPHVTDATNACRTLLYDIHSLSWDEWLLQIFGVKRDALPAVHPSQYAFGMLKKDILGIEIPVNAVCGDQQASMAAAGRAKGTTKVTYGTGTFVMQSLGRAFSRRKGFFTTLIPYGGIPYYALEAKIDTGGFAIENVLGNSKKLHSVLTSLALSVDDCLKRLPMRPKKIIIDGGVTRDGRMGIIQAEVSRVPVHMLGTFRGTALGVAKLLLDKYHSQKS